MKGLDLFFELIMWPHRGKGVRDLYHVENLFNFLLLNVYDKWW